MPAVVIIHGAWHPPYFYDELVSSLHVKGFNIVQCPRLPSASESLPLPPNANLAGDTATVRSVVKTLVDEGQDVIVLMHSYGGVVGGNSLDGLLSPQRRAQGLRGGVLHLIYMAAFVIPPGTALDTPFDGQMMPWLEEDTTNDIIHMKDARHAFYAHIESDEEAQKWLEMTVLCPASTLKDQQEYAPYEHVGHGVDATYLVCSRDKELTSPVQEGMASLLGESRRMEYCDAGHCCMLGGYAPLVADVVERACKASYARVAT